jgi:hypothetical protein
VCGICNGDGSSCIPTPTPTPECNSDEWNGDLEALIEYMHNMRKVLRQLLGKINKISCAREPATLRFIKRTRRQFRQTAKANEAYLASYSISITSCVCTSALSQGSNDNLLKRVELLQTLSQRLLRRIRNCRSGGECEGAVTECRRRALQREREYQQLNQRMEDAYQNAQAVIKALPDIDEYCR